MSIWIWIITFALIIALGIVLFWYFRRKKKIKDFYKASEYGEVEREFNLAEKMYEDELKGGGEYDKPNPYEILWRIAKNRRRQYVYAGAPEGAELPPLPKLPSGGSSIPGSSSKTTGYNEPEHSEYQRSNRKGFLGRRRRFLRRD